MFLIFNYQTDKSPTHNSFEDSSAEDGSYVNKNEKPAIRLKQQHGFVYLIQTNEMEVVPLIDNYVLNPLEAASAGFVTSAEVHISVPEDGIPSSRIWSVNSQGTKAIKVDDLNKKFPVKIEEFE